jgi:hexosaminidase
MNNALFSRIRAVVISLVASAALSAGAADQILGYQLDISRCKVPTRESMNGIVDILATLGYNQFQLYTEHTFAYTNHYTVWCEASPMTPWEIRQLDAYCAAKGVELVPNQNSLGHFEQWLRHPEYADLAELPGGGAVFPKWGNYVCGQTTSLCPTDPRSLELVAGLYDELLPNFKSRYFNVGCDEPIELFDALKRGRSRDEIAAKGAERVYLEYLLKIHELVKSRNRTMMFWGDIILDKPELVPELPEDAICLAWGYEANHPFETQAAAFERAKRKYILCPGTSAWGSLSGRVTNMLGNIDNAVAAGERHGTMGYMLADWGDRGNPQPWIVSLPALVYLSHRVKGERPTRGEIAAEIDRLLGCTCGESLLAYGDIYLACGGRTGNTAELFLLLQGGSGYRRAAGVTDETLAAALKERTRAQSLLDLSAAPEWVKDDFATLDLLYRAVETRIAEPGKKNIRSMYEAEYRRLWLKRNRRGGLKDSLSFQFGN